MVKSFKYILIFIFFLSFIISCSNNKLKQIEGSWEFKYGEISEYQIIFENGSFIFIETEFFTDETIQFIIQGSYEIDEKIITLSGNQGDVAVDGRKAATPELMEMWNGTYSYKIAKENNVLTLTKNESSISFMRKGGLLSEENKKNNDTAEKNKAELDNNKKKIDYYELYVLLKDKTEFNFYKALSFEETENALMIVLENQEHIEIPSDSINIVMKNEVYAKNN